MEVILLILLVIIFIETTFLLVKNFTKTSVRSGSTRRKLYVDSSALMDGRILKVAQSGFLSGSLIIPRSVIREMQLVADGKDSEKRARARYGISLVNELERVVHCDTEILQDALDHTPVDERLLQLAKENHGAIITNDYNLEKVAQTERIDVLNVNALAASLHADFLPGETFELHVQSAGSNPKQGLGYLPDGTMVIVENGQKYLNKDIKVEFVRFIQTATGRMIFAKIPRAGNVVTKTTGTQASSNRKIASRKNSRKPRK